MSTRDTFMRSKRGYDRKNSLDYSRHLCVTTRTITSFGNRPSRSSSDSEAKMLLGRPDHGPYDDFKKRNLTLSRQVSDGGRVPRRRVYSMDQTLHRKFGHKNERKTRHPSEPTAHWVNKEAGPRKPMYYGMDDEPRSFCDSVSSIACSNLTKATYIHFIGHSP
ncbi:hypothetical protein OS493_027355 [Desmophyllum pertusum]|uniref:Uncharacterized protein n=1 Tax=Desmophyllum pertusum TaxID=174260 RepID=A0A9W9YXM0_9CNID|nr:hypothetical protein OS493_027355 [Desmophyllum pertusum]